MRVVTVMAVLLLGGAATLEAQHRFQFEIGGFASFTRFDRALQLDNQIGGGGRIGFWITDWLGIEGDGLVQRPHPKGGGAGTDFPVWFASGSIVLNFGSEKSFYILGGYSAMDFNSNAAGGFRDVGAHGAIGDRIFITDRVALRLEAGAYYAPKTQAPAERGGRARQRPVRQPAPHDGRCARVPSAGRSGAVRGRWVRHHGSVECPGELRELRRLGLGPAPGRGRPGGDQGLFLVDGRGRHQAGSAGAVRPIHPDIGGGQLPDPRHHPHLPGRRPLFLRLRQRRGHGPAVSTRRKFSPRILRTSLSG